MWTTPLEAPRSAEVTSASPALEVRVILGKIY